jgi:hypothetical protein
MFIYDSGEAVTVSLALLPERAGLRFADDRKWINLSDR